jgi:hypothetical protein
MQKTETETRLLAFTLYNSKWSKDLNVRPENLKL